MEGCDWLKADNSGGGIPANGEKTLIELFVVGSVTRLGDLLDFGQLFKACGNN